MAEPGVGPRNGAVTGYGSTAMFMRKVVARYPQTRGWASEVLRQQQARRPEARDLRPVPRSREHQARSADTGAGTVRSEHGPPERPRLADDEVDPPGELAELLVLLIRLPTEQHGIGRALAARIRRVARDEEMAG